MRRLRYDLVAGREEHLAARMLHGMLDQMLEPRHFLEELLVREHIGPVPIPNGCVADIGQVLMQAARGNTWALQSE